MTYRCYVCHKVSKPKEPKLTHQILRSVPSKTITRRAWNEQRMRDERVETLLPERTEIALEIPVCFDHKACLDNGIPLTALMRQNEQARNKAAIKPKRVKPSILAKALRSKSPVKTQRRPIEVFAQAPIKLKGAATKRK